MTPYRVFVEAGVFATLRGFKRSEQLQFIRLLDRLADDPYQEGDYAERDEIGRLIQVLVSRRHAVYFWADHAVKEVKILDLKPAGR
ncbi:MAG: hypothetical protein HY301_17455 [Verrucomicrobia bacterium]|nr:hypothetical protein [Verrucomicrobiota bacterium]